MESELIDLVRSGAWLMRVLGAVRGASLPDAWAGAGVLRELVRGERYGPGFRPDRVRDGAVAFFALQDLSRANDDRGPDRFAPRLPAVPWETKYQAPVHTWYSRKFSVRISIEHFLARLARHSPHIRWPYVPIEPPDARR